VTFEKRRVATPEELARLWASFAHGVSGLRKDDEQLLAEAEISRVGTLTELAAVFTGLSVAEPHRDGRGQRTVAECEAEWRAGGGTGHDQESYRRGLALAGDPEYQPELLFMPSRRVRTGYLLVDAIHRAAALYSCRRVSRTEVLDTIAYVLPRPFAP
jgi:hypothetical protein